MSEVTDLILSGVLCQHCGSYIDDSFPGYPRSCDDCEEE